MIRMTARALVRKLPGSVDIEDLVSEGALAYFLAARHFDPKRGILFSTYAAPRVRGAMLDFLRKTDPVRRSHRTLCAQQGRPPPRTRHISTLDADDEQRTAPSDPAFIAPDGQYDDADRRDLADFALCAMKPVERTVCFAYYHQHRTLAEIAVLMGVHESRVCQIHTSALRRARLATKKMAERAGLAMKEMV